MADYYGMHYGRRFGREVIKAFGGKVTPQKLRFFDAWARAEGTKAAYNPFATTRKGFPGETNFNPVGVKNYPDLQTGVKATIDTLKLGYYTEIVDLLRNPNATAEDLAKAVAASPWGTGTGVLRVLGVTQSEAYERARSTAQYGVKKGQVEQSYQTVVLDRFRPSQHYLKTLESIGGPAKAALNLASGFQPFTKQVPVSAPVEEPPVGGDEVTLLANRGVQFTPKGMMILPTSWKGTHVTDGLDWNYGAKTATDIMGHAGTAVGAPEPGTVVKWGSAQGGEALYFRGRSGRMYWIGHIDDRLPVGTQVKRGQRIAIISADHPRPHVHIDVKTPSGRIRGGKTR